MATWGCLSAASSVESSPRVSFPLPNLNLLVQLLSLSFKRSFLPCRGFSGRKLGLLSFVAEGFELSFAEVSVLWFSFQLELPECWTRLQGTECRQGLGTFSAVSPGLCWGCLCLALSR